jgi:hypothetical protein
MQAICEECGSIYKVEQSLPNDFTCFCKSEKFKILEEEKVAVPAA